MYTTSITCWLDLEQTIIASWDDVFLINVGSIKEFLKDRGITEVGIFSFAIYNEADKEEFQKNVKPIIERALGVTVILWPSVRDMIRIDKQYTGDHFDSENEVHDYIQFRGKKDGFINYINATCNFDTAILIDDVVPDLTLSHRFDGWSIELWNVDSLGKRK